MIVKIMLKKGIFLQVSSSKNTKRKLHDCLVDN